MQDVRIDSEGKLRCWNCGTSEQFVQQRTTRSKVLVGVGALLTKKKLKCVVCGKYNQTGNAKPYLGGTPQERAAGWFADPWQQAGLRWFDGAQWTGHTRE